ncbi:MAG: hypothetical protein HFE75_05350 [Firmicutes bacterium]|jgi:hypothetical protein|nr:hypothetical protein [Bacillota bacterium]NBI63849.1 hypothetical protein [Clostridiales bacterium]
MSKEEHTAGKSKVIVYVVIRVLVVAVMIAQILNHNWHNVFTCALTLVLLLLPSILAKRLRIVLPNTLEIIIVCFIFAAEILGEVREYYVLYERWDDMLHTMNGFLAAAIGFALIDILNRHEKVSMSLSPVFVASVAFCFSMTIGVLWEFFEFSMDYFAGADMQKDTWLSSFNSVALNPEGANVPVHVEVDCVTVNGQTWDKYLDIGLFDTMHDLFVNFIGAVVFSILGLIYIKNRGKGLAAKFIPTRKDEGAETE